MTRAAQMRTNTFSGAIKLLGDRHDRVTIGNNTTIEAEWLDTTTDGDEWDRQQIVTVRLHGHAIVRLFANGDVAVRDCGYVTPTTYGRLSAFMPPGWMIRRQLGQGIAVNLRTHEALDVQGDEWTLVTA